MKLLYEVDVQRDFYDPRGALYIQDAELRLPNIIKLHNAFKESGHIVTGSVDCHDETAPEFIINGGIFPFHCIDGSDGFRRPEAICKSDWRVDRSDAWYTSARELSGLISNIFMENLMFEKSTYDILDNEVFLPIMLSIVKSVEVSDIYVVGFATDICLKAAIPTLKSLGVNIHIVTDAVEGVDKDASAAFLAQVEGVALITSEKLLGELKGDN